jgi:hypothetical protein
VYGNASKTPIVLIGLRYPVTITDTYVQIGCECHTAAEWDRFNEERIARMDGCTSRRFWQAHSETILTLAAYHQSGIAADKACGTNKTECSADA